jgi:hypothetical protein
MLRVYAMYSRNKRMLAFWISACLLLVGIAVVGDLLHFSRQVPI